MPSPFPGMDPYLEGDLWPGFHHELAVEVKRQLVPLLKPNYYPFTERYYLVDSDEVAIEEARINPDVGIVRKSAKAEPLLVELESEGPVVMELPMLIRRAHYRVEIRDIKKRNLVAVIEFLSPVNKRGKGREEYLQKREKIIQSKVHLIEIDLLRKGQRLPVMGKLPPGGYYGYVSRSQERPKIKVWPLPLGKKLPALPIPLLKKSEEVWLDLSQAIAAVHDAGDYGELIDYQQSPDIPLFPAEMAWLDGVLRAAGVRK